MPAAALRGPEASYTIVLAYVQVRPGRFDRPSTAAAAARRAVDTAIPAGPRPRRHPGPEVRRTRALVVGFFQPPHGYANARRVIAR